MIPGAEPTVYEEVPDLEKLTVRVRCFKLVWKARAPPLGIRETSSGSTRESQITAPRQASPRTDAVAAGGEAHTKCTVWCPAVPGKACCSDQLECIFRFSGGVPCSYV